MASDLNMWTGVGRLGRDPETRYLPSGESVTNFSIACGDKWKDKNSGDLKERTEWVNIVAFGKLAEICGQYLKKGKQVLIVGALRTRKWQDKDSGKDRYSTEVVAEKMQMLGDASGGQGSRDNNNQAASGAKPASQPATPPSDSGFDDDIPF